MLLLARIAGASACLAGRFLRAPAAPQRHSAPACADVFRRSRAQSLRSLRTGTRPCCCGPRFFEVPGRLASLILAASARPADAARIRRGFWASVPRCGSGFSSRLLHLLTRRHWAWRALRAPFWTSAVGNVCRVPAGAHRFLATDFTAFPPHHAPGTCQLGSCPAPFLPVDRPGAG